MFGIFNIHKRAGWTSHGVIQRVRRLAGRARTGYAGTLDPLAEGVLVVCVGPATRLLNYVQQMPKQYVATFMLGRRSPSDDLETPVETLSDPPRPTLAEVEAALKRFTGEIHQRPPAYSAVKVEGRRAYELARQGAELALAPRPVQVDRLLVRRYDYPSLELEIDCGSGMYVRSLGRDVAEALGTHAVMTNLVRCAVGPFRLDDAIDAAGMGDEPLLQRLQSPLMVVSHLPRLVLSAEQVAWVHRGMLVRNADFALPTSLPPNAAFAAIDERGGLVAILKEARPGLLRPSPNFRQSE